MKLVSWNVNGFRACVGKGFWDYFRNAEADFFCLQETKMQPGQADMEAEGYHLYMNSAEKKGYSGTAIFAKEPPMAVTYGIGEEEHDHEGRVITLEYPEYYVAAVYTPNSQRGLTRLDYRMTWEDSWRKYLSGLDEKKPVIVCGDMNVAHKEIDLKNPKSNTQNAGFTIQEREKMTALLEAGFVDTFRYLYPDRKDIYSWWSYMFHARENNAGWRIDYFLCSERVKEKIREATIETEVFGSDHCPVTLEME
ncbi:MAG: exodeoxyribonuclease III [Clostridia bacterium]|nr:exodeoxyribonuclease III [Clostridia bacterium]